jgi:hypothetical protein
LGKEKLLGEVMVATKFEPHDNWLPPGFHVSQQFEQALIDSGQSNFILKPYKTRYQILNFKVQRIKKALVDFVEIR